MSAANYLVRWMPGIVEATADDIALFGPNAAQVRALLNYLPTISDDAARASDKAEKAARDAAMWPAMADARQAARGAAGDAARVAASDAAYYAADKAVWDVAGGAARDAARYTERDAAWDAARNAARGASLGEIVSDLITPEQYRLLTNPLNAVRTLQERMGLMLPDQQGPFMQMINQLRPVSAEDVLAIERLSGNPNMAALLEMLTSPQMAPGQSLARRIRAAETMYRVGRGGKGMS